MIPKIGSLFSVMYHYVNDNDFNNSLSVSDFITQVETIDETFGILTENDWDSVKSGETRAGCLLTFDDGLKDHIMTVAPILEERSLHAVFFINTDPLKNSTSLTVHKVHWLIWNFNPELVWGLIEKYSKEFDFQFLSKGRNLNYERHGETLKTNQIKTFFNYSHNFLITDQILNLILFELDFNEQEFSQKQYLASGDVLSLSNAGFGIGSHGTNHILMPTLSASEQEICLLDSKAILEDLTDKVCSEFCYPYGGPSAVNDEIQNLVFKSGYLFAHGVESRAISINDLSNRFHLPRFDCSEFKYL